MTMIARQAKDALELVHAMIYFAPEPTAEFDALGLERGLMQYLVGRSAAMGRVGPGAVTATFYNFAPGPIAEVIPRAWSIAAPEDVLAARLRAADVALRRMLGEEVGSTAVVDAADLAERAATGCSPEGKPLYAAHADLDRPAEPHLRLWHAVTLLREFRGDAHLAALQRAGLPGLDALVLHSATGSGFTPAAARKTRGWTEQEWTAAEQRLRERGLVDPDGGVTEQGTALREAVESDTDAMSMGPWEVLGEDGTEVLCATGVRLTKQLLAAGAVPQGLFGRG
ncbi:SCO6745 family protein [Saccharopolyspora cebuensis]|uniref:SalK n=1 Tax=Saccharopolyspora cebuensis TaxID=418759 RepID=A0ABV4CC05_9PSEU